MILFACVQIESISACLRFLSITGVIQRVIIDFYKWDKLGLGIEGRIWDLIVTVPDHCLSFYFDVYMNHIRT